MVAMGGHKGFTRWVAILTLLITAAACSRSSSGPSASSPPPSGTPSTAAAHLTSLESPRPVAAWPAGENEIRHVAFGSVDRLIAFLRRRMDIPIRLPAGLPSDVRLDPSQGPLLLTRDGERAAQFGLDLGDGRVLILQYGVSVFDGCPSRSDTVPVRVAGQVGRLIVSRGPQAELIWPATWHLTGVYGLQGPFSRREILAMARSMAPGPAPLLFDVGC